MELDGFSKKGTKSELYTRGKQILPEHDKSKNNKQK